MPLHFPFETSLPLRPEIIFHRNAKRIRQGNGWWKGMSFNFTGFRARRPRNDIESHPPRAFIPEIPRFLSQLLDSFRSRHVRWLKPTLRDLFPPSFSLSFRFQELFFSPFFYPLLFLLGLLFDFSSFLLFFQFILKRSFSHLYPFLDFRYVTILVSLGNFSL